MSSQGAAYATNCLYSGLMPGSSSKAPSRTLMNSESCGCLLQSADPQPEQNTFAKPWSGTYERISSSPETTRSEPGVMRAETEAAVPVRR
jgi:hypothetical protein